MRQGALLLLVIHALAAQTKPRPEQILNSNQVRVCSNPPACVDPRPGTLVPAEQIQDGRQKLPSPSSMTDEHGDPADVGTPTVCLVNYIGLNLADAGYVLRSLACFTQFGLAALLTDPAWAAWWSAQP